MLSRIQSKTTVTGPLLLSLSWLALGDLCEAAAPTPVFEPSAVAVDRPNMRPGRPFNALPSAFDLRDEGRVAPLYPDTDCRTCWAYASTYVMESLLLPWEETDLSQDHMQMEAHQSCGSGGSIRSAMNYLTSGNGPIAESDYQLMLAGKLTDPQARTHVRQIRVLPIRKHALDNDAIKDAIYNHGPLYASVNGRSITNTTYHTSYTTYNVPIHAVVLIGWDDQVPKEHFTYTYQGTTYTPDGDGAFIVQNYERSYYLSYYDAAVGYNEVAWFSAEPVSNHQRIYQHDPHGTFGWIAAYQIPGNGPGDFVPSIYGANVFTASEDGTLSSIGFPFQHYVLPEGEQATMEVAIHLDPDDGPRNSNGPALSFTTLIADGGYHSIELPSQIPVAAGQRFSVVLRGYESSRPQDEMHLAVELAPHTPSMSIAAGESYISRDGWDWIDMTEVPFVSTNPATAEWRYGNLGIKAYTKAPFRGHYPAMDMKAKVSLSKTTSYLSQLRPVRPVFSVDSAPVPEFESPQNGSTVANGYPPISLRFADQIKPGPALALITLSTYNQTRQVYASVQGDTLSIYPVGPLGSSQLGGEQWTVRIPADAVVDGWGNPMEQAYSWSFEVIGVN